MHLTYANLLDQLSADAMDHIRRQPISSPGGEIENVESVLHKRIDPVIDLTLEALREESVWVHLLRQIPPPQRREVVIRCTRRGKVNGDTWPAVCQARSYSFSRSRLYGSVLALAAAMSLLAIWQAVSMLTGNLRSVEGIAALLCGLSVAGTWVWLRSGSRRSSSAVAGIDTFYFSEALLGTLVVPVELFEYFRSIPSSRIRSGISAREVKQLVFFLFLPGGCWLATAAIASRFSTVTGVVTVAGVLLLGIALATYGGWRQQNLMMPFSGFFLDPPGESSIKPAFT